MFCSETCHLLIDFNFNNTAYQPPEVTINYVDSVCVCVCVSSLVVTSLCMLAIRYSLRQHQQKARLRTLCARLPKAFALCP